MRANAALLAALAACQTPALAGSPPFEAGGFGGAPHAQGGSGGDPRTELAFERGALESWQPLPRVTPVPSTGAEVCRPDGWCWTRPLPTGAPLVTAAGQGPGVWLGGKGELLRWTDGAFESSAWSFELDVRAIAVDGRAVWVAAGPEVARFDGLAWTRWATPEGTLATDVAASDDLAWVVLRAPSGGTLVEAAGGGFRRWIPSRALDVTSIASSPRRPVVAGTSAGTLEWAGTWKLSPLPAVRDVCFTGSAKLVAALSRGGIQRRTDGGAWVEVSGRAALELVCGDLVHARTQTGWLEGGLDSLAPGPLGPGDRVLVDIPSSDLDWTVRDGALLAGGEPMQRFPGTPAAILETAPDGTVWAGGVGASRFDPANGWTDPLLPELAITGIAPRDGGVWATAADRVVRLDAAEPDLIVRRPALGRGRVLRVGAQDRLLRRAAGGWIDELPPEGTTVSLLDTGDELLAVVDRTSNFELRALTGDGWTLLASFRRFTYGTLLPTPGGTLLADGGRLDGLGRARAGKISRLRGGRLHHVLFPGRAPASVASIAAGDDELWFAAEGDVLHGTRERWEGVALPGVRVLRRSPGGEIWAAGEGGLLLHGPDLAAVAAGVDSRLNALGFTGGEVLVAGDGGVLLRGDASGFAQVPTGSRADLLAVAALGSHTFVGVAAEDSASGLLELDGGSLLPLGRASAVIDLLALDDEVFGVGRPSLVHRVGSSWERVGVLADAIAGNGARDVWLSTPDEGLRHWTRAGMESPGIAVTGPLAVSPRGTVWSSDGSSLRAVVTASPVADELAPWATPVPGLVAAHGDATVAVVSAPEGEPGPDLLLRLRDLEVWIEDRLPCAARALALDRRARTWIGCASLPGGGAGGLILHRR